MFFPLGCFVLVDGEPTLLCPPFIYTHACTHTLHNGVIITKPRWLWFLKVRCCLDSWLIQMTKINSDKHVHAIKGKSEAFIYGSLLCTSKVYIWNMLHRWSENLFHIVGFNFQFQNKNETFSSRKKGRRTHEADRTGKVMHRNAREQWAFREQHISSPKGNSSHLAVARVLLFSCIVCNPQHRHPCAWHVRWKCSGQPLTKT